jgi:hypothetical protein
MPVRDVAQITAHAKVDWDVVTERARNWKLVSVVRHALETVRDTLGAAIPEEARAVMAIRPRHREVRALEAYITDRRQRGGTAVSVLRAIPSLRGKIAYARALLFPNREFLAVRQRSERPSYLRRLAIPIRWLTRRRGSLS